MKFKIKTKNGKTKFLKDKLKEKSQINVTFLIYNYVKYLKLYENRIFGKSYVTILDEDIEKFLPQKMDIYTMGGGGDGGGNYKLELGDVTRETDIIRITYTQNTTEITGGDVTADGEPNILEFDIHFIHKDSVLKINVDLSYGDSMVSSFSLEQPNKINVNHYTGLGSHSDPESHFGLCEESIKELVKFFNRFGFQIHEKDFSFLDKYPETYVHENLRLTPLSGDKKILLVNNSKPQENRYFKNLQKWCQNRGIQYVMAISDRDVERICQNENIVGVVLSGSDFRITKPMEEGEGGGSRKALELLTCPILGVCYGFQTMAKYHGSTIKDGEKFHLDNLVLTEVDDSHPLFKGVAVDNTQFSFAYNDTIESCPDGFKVIAKINDTIAGIADDNKKRYGLLFHPEDMQRTYTILDNFIAMFDNVQKGQDALKMGKFQYLESYSTFLK
jgi:GMP synthase-like glutamine amidotransferase